MMFCSTRDRNTEVTAAQAILQGLAPDGGLFVPTALPSFSPEQIEALASLDYRQTAKAVLPAFLPGFSEEELSGWIDQAYGPQFDDPRVAPVRAVRPGVWSMELWHGPTCAFKDFALQMLPRLLPAAAKKCGTDKTVAILTATSGDTGKAALEGFADVPGTKICVFYPHGGVSEMQRRQMASQTGGNVQVLAVEGNFDDTQSGVKTLFSDEALRSELAQKGVMLSSANSINWGRLAPQIVYYFWAYARLLKEGAVKIGDPVNFCVPTGNFGNILAGYFAKKCGLPVGRLICASNENNVLTQFLNTGVYDRNREFHLTASPSMDILISSNLERLLFLLTGDDVRVRSWMEHLRKKGVYSIGEELLEKLHEEGFVGYCCTDDKAAHTIHELWFGRGCLCDTHTGVAANALQQHASRTGDKTPAVIVSTASPFKFASAILPAIDVPFDGDDFQKLEALEIVSSMSIPEPLKRLKTAELRFDRVISKADMKKEVESWLSADPRA